MDSTTRDLERAADSQPDDHAAILRWCAALRRGGVLGDRAGQETLVQRVARFDAATRSRLILEGFGVVYGYRTLMIEHDELDEFDFKRAGYDWTIQCWTAKYSRPALDPRTMRPKPDSRVRTAKGRRLDIDIFGPPDVKDHADNRRYENASTRTLVRLLAEPPPKLAQYEGWHDAGIMDDDPELHAFARELTEAGAKFEPIMIEGKSRLVSFGGHFAFDFEGRHYSGAWNADMTAKYGPSMDIFSDDDCPDGYLRSLWRDPDAEMLHFTHPLDLIDAIRRSVWSVPAAQG